MKLSFFPPGFKKKASAKHATNWIHYKLKIYLCLLILLLLFLLDQQPLTQKEPFGPVSYQRELNQSCKVSLYC